MSIWMDELAAFATPAGGGILLSPARREGRQLLSACARRRPVVGVEVHTMASLALELCGPALSAPDAPRLLTPLQTRALVLELLEGLAGGGGDLDRPALRTNAGARALWSALEELELFQTDPAQCRDGSPRLAALAELQEKLRETLNRRNLLTRPGLLALALAETEAGRAPRIGERFAALSHVVLTPLERAVWEAATGRTYTLIPLTRPEGEAPLPGTLPGERPVADLGEIVRGRSRFVSCRGMEREIRFILEDVLRRGRPLAESAVAALTPELALALRAEGARLGIPISVAGGIPLADSPLTGLLRGLRDWREGGYEAEALIPLLWEPSFAVPHKLRLADRLRRQRIGWGWERYTLLSTPQEGESQEESDARQTWGELFNALFRALEPSLEQELGLDTFLENWIRPVSPESGGARLQLRSLLAQLEGDGRTSLADKLLEAAGESTYSPGAAGPDALFCGTPAECLGTGADTLYLPGLCQYALDPPRRESPLLTPEERTALGLPDPGWRDRPLEDWGTLLCEFPGRFVFSRPDFDLNALLELPPAAVYEDLRAACGVPEERLDARPVPAPCPAPSTAAAQIPAAEQVPDLAEAVAAFRFSPSALEVALDCPRRFYLQYLLRLRRPEPVERSTRRWLEPNLLGTFVHGVLEDFTRARLAGEEPDLEDLLTGHAARLRVAVPPAGADVMAADLERARACVLAGAELARQAVPVCAELRFGEEGDDLSLPLSRHTILLTGSIDRVDREADGTYTIVDYKTGDGRRFRREQDRHLQHLLYTLAAEQLLGEGAHVDRAVYQFLAPEEARNRVLSIRETPEKRRQVQAVVDALVELLGREETAWLARPCFTWDDGEKALVPGEDEARRRALDACARYCPYADFCRSR